MSKNKSTTLDKSIDPAVHVMLDRASALNLETAWDRYEKMLPQCGFGELGVCCRNCNMGPCRISPFDDNGPHETHYTNDPGSVPRQYRDDTDIKGEIGSYSYSDEDYDDDEGYNQETDLEESEDMEQPQTNSGQISDLKARQEAFNKEFKALEEERALLDKAMRNAEGRDELEAVNAKTQEFNNRYKDFHMRRKAFKTEVKKYNEQVRQDMENRLKEYKEKQTSQNDE